MEFNFKQFKNRFKQGKMTLEEIGRGMHKCYLNARSLIEDANTLLPSRPARAISLAVLAMEETAKIFLLTNAAAKVTKGSVPWSEIEKSLRLLSHENKQRAFLAYGQNILSDTLKSVGEKLYKEELPTNIAPLLDWFKQLGFYVDVGEGKFMTPDEFGAANIKWAHWLIDTAIERLDSIKKMHETEESSIKVVKRAGELAHLIEQSKNEQQLREKLRDFLKRLKD
jgi:AbiV family abortive infection protein